MPTDGHAGPAPLTAAWLERVPGVLGRISLERLQDYEQDYGEAQPPLLPGRQAIAPNFQTALAREGLSLIAEVKRASPSKGAIAELEPVAAARAYARGGAHAISVLSEPRHFGGSLEHVRQVARAVALPVLRKDFTVHPAQLTEAAQAGASAVLLIVAVLGEHLKDYLEAARALGLDALVEVHDETELEGALAAGSSIIGVNNRDLRSLEIDLSNAPRLMQRARAAGFSGLLVAESGYSSAAELAHLQGLADAVLVGSSLAASGELEGAVRQLLGASA